MSQADLKMSYNASLLRVRCEFSRATTMASELPPADLLARAKAKMEAVRAAGDCAFYQLYESRLAETWRGLRAAIDEPEDRRLTLTLAAGAPLLPGVKVERSTLDKTLVALSIEAARDSVAAWRWEWFKLTLQKRLRDLGLAEQPNLAQVFGAFTRARLGEKVAGVTVGVAATAGGGGNQRTYSVVANKQRMEIGVVVRSFKELRTAPGREQLLALVAQAVKQLSDGGVSYRVLQKDVTAALASALDGPEAVGVEMPLVLLAAVGQSLAAKAAAVPSTGPGTLTFDVSNDRMEATIAGFQMNYYDNPHAPATVDWVQNELKRCLIPVPMESDIVKSLGEAIRNHENLNGRVATRGVPGRGGKGPYVHPS
jgi:hypothetical protein